MYLSNSDRNNPFYTYFSANVVNLRIIPTATKGLKKYPDTRIPIFHVAKIMTSYYTGNHFPIMRQILSNFMTN